MSNHREHTSCPPALQEVLDDLCMRFLVNLPVEEYESFERLFFAIESAHWFYDDFYRDHDPSLPRLPLKQFAARLFGHTALLHRYHDQVEKLTAQFQSYKQVVMTCGAALLNPTMDKVVLVRGWGNNARWGFPKGKLGKDETELTAAAREVFEETGFDMKPYIKEDQFYVDSFTSGRHCRIYFVQNIPEDTVFETMTRKEISDIQWVPISVLPDSPKSVKNQSKPQTGKNGKILPGSEKKMLFAQNGVVSFTKRLRAWIKRQRKQTAVQTLATDQRQNVSLPSLPIEFQIDSRPPEPHHMLSLDEIEANLRPATKNSSSGKRRNSRVNPSGNLNPRSREGTRKSKKEVANMEEKRNRMTFGADGGSAMDEAERNKLFRRYVVETDQIAAAQGLRDEFWPVPFVTSKDFSPHEVEEAKNMTKSVPPTVCETTKSLSTTAPRDERGEPNPQSTKMATKLRNLTPPSDKSFSFDRKAILAHLTRNNPS